MIGELVVMVELNRVSQIQCLPMKSHTIPFDNLETFIPVLTLWRKSVDPKSSAGELGACRFGGLGADSLVAMIRGSSGMSPPVAASVHRHAVSQPEASPPIDSRLETLPQVP